MDIIDIILARALTPQGQTETYVSIANAAAAKAAKAEEDAAAAIATVTAAAEDIEATQLAASNLFEDLDDTLDSLPDYAGLDERTTALETQIADAGGTVTVSANNTSAAKIQQLNVTKNNETTSYIVEKNYTSDGNNEDGSMTQKAIKTYVEGVKSDLQSQINGGGGSGSINFDPDDAGYMLFVNSRGEVTTSGILANDIINALLRSNSYTIPDTVGVECNYTNKTFARIQEATGKSAGAHFDQYTMYGGRKRCNVSDNGTITAWYGDNNYREDGTNGQVMIYQPKFYYCRVPIDTAPAALGSIVRQEMVIISALPQTGFKLHPAFYADDNSELDYILIGAYEGSIYNTSTSTFDILDNVTPNFSTDKLCSIANVKPASGVNKNFTIENAEQLAINRGTGWHITNLQVESVNQMLIMIEYCSTNGQSAFESGIVDLPVTSSYNCASHTGSTSSLGNSTGYATSTLNITNNTTVNYDVNGKRAISYRGMENPWGNIAHFIGGVNIYGDGSKQGGLPFVCWDHNYRIDAESDSYDSIGFYLPNSSNWTSGFGISSNPDYDWIFLPAETSVDANSYVPIGDYTYVDSNLNDVNCLVGGGSANSKDYAGLFYCGADNDINAHGRNTGARLMFVPTKNNIYTANYTSWQNKMREVM